MTTIPGVMIVLDSVYMVDRDVTVTIFVGSSDDASVVDMLLPSVYSTVKYITDLTFLSVYYTLK